VIIRLIYIAILGLIITVKGPLAFAQERWEELFFKANKAYNEGRYEEAAKGYEELIRKGYANGHIYYNLGNTYFRMNRLGLAILNYERARLFIPRDPDLDFNLRYVRDKTIDAIEEQKGFIDITFFWLNSLSLNEIFWSFALMNLLFWGSLFLRIFLKSEWLYYINLSLMIVWFIGGISFGLKSYKVIKDNRAVIVQNEVNVLAGPDPQDTVLFKLHDGAIVRYERSEDGWSLISLPDKKRGWVKAGAVEPVMIDCKPVFTAG